MPELLEVETYRRQAEAVVGRTIAAVEAPDEWFVKGAVPAEVVAAVTGRTVTAVRRRGKLLVLDLDDGAVGPEDDGDRLRLGLRFGMTGRLLVDGTAAIDRLEYSSSRDEPRWDRFTCASPTAPRCGSATPVVSAAWRSTPTRTPWGPMPCR